MSAHHVFTHCLICEQLCGLDVEVENNRVASIRPDKANPYTWRDFCIKGQRAGEVAGSPWRITSPMRRTPSGFVRASWDDLIEDVGGRLERILDHHGPGAVAGYAGNPFGFSYGSVLWHNLFLMQIGTQQIYSVQSIDSNAKHVATGAMFGVEMMALVPDLDLADFVVLVGTNPAVSKFNWGGKVPNGWRRLKDRVRNGAQLVVVDPRCTETAEHATRHVAPIPDSDWALLLGMVKVILEDGLDRLPAEAAIDGLTELADFTGRLELSKLAGICGVAADVIAEVARGFAGSKTGFVMAGTGPALGTNGTLAQWLALVLNVITDRIERPGGRFMPNWPVPWQNRLAQMRKPPKRTSRVRSIPVVAGNRALAELPDEILTEGEGQVRALIMGGGNPVSTGPDGERMDRALASLDLLVSLDLFQRESHRHAHWLVPAQHFLEREEVHIGLHAYNEQPFIQTTRRALDPPPEVKPEWMFYRDLAARLGKPMFGGQDMDPTKLAAATLAGGGLITLDAIRAEDHGLVYGERSMGNLWDMLSAEERPIRLWPDEFAVELQRQIMQAPGRNPNEFRLVSRRRNGMMNASLTETSGSAVADETAECVEVALADAARLGLADRDHVVIKSAIASLDANVVLSEHVRPGTLVIAHGWGSPLYDPANGSEVFRKGIPRNRLVSGAEVDALSGVPALNGSLVEMVRAP